MKFKNKVILGDCVEVMSKLPEESIAYCITDPPYNYEVIGKSWNNTEITRRLQNIESKSNKTLVKNIPYGNGLSGGVRNANWYAKNRKNNIAYQKWIRTWGKELYRVCKPGAIIAVFNSNRSVAHVQVALEKCGFYAKDCIVYRRSSGIPKGYNAEQQLKKKGLPFEDYKGWHSCLLNDWEGIVIMQKPLSNNHTETLQKFNTGLLYTKADENCFQSNIIENIKRDKVKIVAHCTPKPLDLMKKLVQIIAIPGKNNILLDLFAGSGSTLVAAKELGINYCGIEIESKYVDLINSRLKGLDK